MKGHNMQKYLNIFFFVIVLLFLSCSTNNSPVSPIDDFGEGTDYDIYSLVLNQVTSKISADTILLSDSTRYWDISNCYESIKSSNDDIDEEILDNYQSVNNESFKLLNIPNLNKECIILSKKSDWKKRYPKAYGIYFLSRVGFNSDSTRALVYIEDYSAPLVATGSLFLLEREENWIIKKTIFDWIS